MRLIEERDSIYGDAWQMAGTIIALAAKQVDSVRDSTPFKELTRSGYAYNWIQMVGKICRLLWSPNDVEHWRDIEGYAQLVIREMEGGGEDKLPF